MTSIGSPSSFFFGGKKAYEVERSLRFNSGDSAYLSRTPSSAGNRKKWTWSAWIKRTNLGRKMLFGTPDSNDPITNIEITSSDTLAFYNYDSGYTWNVRPSRVFRDVGAWFHLVLVADTGNSTSGDRIQIYFNGVRETSFGTETYPSQNYEGGMNKTIEHRIGSQGNRSGQFLDGYMAEINFVDGQAYDASYFGQTDSITGQWNPKKYVGSYGTNGFYLNFSDNSGTTATTLGKDSSGNGNNFTPNNFSVAAGVGNDSLIDTPNNNFCTLNPLDVTSGTFSNGNLNIGLNAGYAARGTFFQSSGKWYFEAAITGGSYQPTYSIIGIQRFSGSKGSYGGTTQIPDGYGLFGGGDKYTGTTASSFSSSISVNDVIGVAYDLDSGSVFFYKNGSLLGGGAAYSSITAGEYAPYISNQTTSNNDMTGFVNFGQRPFATSDGEPPSGYKALNSANLPDPTILLPNKHFGSIKYTGDGTSSHSITNSATVDFTPDWVWIKRNAAEGHGIFDSMRGVTKRLRSDTNNKETTSSGVTAFVNNGFTLGTVFNVNSSDYVSWNWNAGDADSKTFKVVVVSDSGNKYRFRNSADSATYAQSAVTLDLEEGGTYVFDWSDSTAQSHPIRFSTTSDGTHGGGTEYTTGVVKDDSAYKTTITVAASAPTLYYYCQNHSGMGGQINTNSTTGSTNFDGSTLSKVKKNLTAGFSIVRYVGTGSAETIGHGLGIAPKVVITKDHTFENNNGVGYSWVVMTTAIDGSLDYMYFNSQNAKTNSSLSAPTSTVFSISNSVTYSRSGEGKINYCFNEVEGFSKFGSYVGNGSTDGTFVYTGFRPAYLIMKSSSHSSFWSVYDNQRDPDNVVRNVQYPNENQADGVGDLVDFTANGFKLRHNSNTRNGSGRTYFYYAFAESPFKNARAR